MVASIISSLWISCDMIPYFLPVPHEYVESIVFPVGIVGDDTRQDTCDDEWLWIRAIILIMVGAP